MIGQTVGNFTIVSKLGHGGMGEVFLGEQRNVKTKVAIKTLLPHISAQTDYVQRFFNEAVAVSRIKHSGIAKIFDVGFLPSGQAYLVMEFLDGETLSSRIERSGRLPVGQLADIGRQISNVLESTHHAGITHRDLKPDNIFLVRDDEMESGERVKILDFGIAKLGETGMTGTSMGSMGTPAYMAPEQWHSSKSADWRSDAYSLGCLTFEMATGRPPFIAASIAEACTKHLSEIPHPLRAVVPEMPAELEALVAKLLEKDPSKRPSSMKEITQSFARLVRMEPPGIAPTLAPPSKGIAVTRVAPTVPVAHAATPARSRRPAAQIVPDTTLGGATGSMHARDRAPHGTSKAVLAALGGIGVLLVALIVIVALKRTGGERSEAPPRDGATTTASVERTVTPSVTPIVTADAAPAAAPPAVVPAPAPATAPPPIATPVRPPVVTAHRPVAAAQPPVAAAHPEVAPSTTSSPPPAPTPAVNVGGGGGCDEVSCVLNNYEGQCCQKFKKGGGRGGTGDATLPELDRGMISAGIAAVKPRVTNCLDSSPAQGKVKVHVTVAPDGHVTEASIEATPDEALGACVAAAVRRASFARTQNGGSFSYPFVF